MNILFRTMITALLASCSFIALADWQLDNDRSSISFVSIKKQDIAEVHHFEQLTGTLTDAGKAQVNIALASVNTGIEIRDTRMREMLFNTAKYSDAVVRVDVDAALINALEVGKLQSVMLQGQLDLHGQSQEFTVACDVILLNTKEVFISSRRAIIVNAADFGLADGITQLTQIAGLPTISKAVPVTFGLLFERQ